MAYMRNFNSPWNGSIVHNNQNNFTHEKKIMLYAVARKKLDTPTVLSLIQYKNMSNLQRKLMLTRDIKRGTKVSIKEK